MIKRMSEAMGAALVHRKILFMWKKSVACLPDIYKALKLFWLSNWVSIARVVARFPQDSLLWPSATAAYLETPFVLASPTSPSYAGALPQELGHLFCSRNLRLSSGIMIAFGSDCQMTGRGHYFDSNLNSAAWPMGFRAGPGWRRGTSSPTQEEQVKEPPKTGIQEIWNIWDCLAIQILEQHTGLKFSCLSMLGSLRLG